MSESETSTGSTICAACTEEEVSCGKFRIEKAGVDLKGEVIEWDRILDLEISKRVESGGFGIKHFGTLTLFYLSDKTQHDSLEVVHQVWPISDVYNQRSAQTAIEQRGDKNRERLCEELQTGRTVVFRTGGGNSGLTLTKEGISWKPVLRKERFVASSEITHYGKKGRKSTQTVIRSIDNPDSLFFSYATPDGKIKHHDLGEVVHAPEKTMFMCIRTISPSSEIQLKRG